MFRVETYKAVLSQVKVVVCKVLELQVALQTAVMPRLEWGRCSGGLICSLPERAVQDVLRFWSEEFPRVEVVACTDSLCISGFATPAQISSKRLGAQKSTEYLPSFFFFFFYLDSRLDLSLRPRSVIRLGQLYSYFLSCVHRARYLESWTLSLLL